jgi:hypothetical protein
MLLVSGVLVDAKRHIVVRYTCTCTFPKVSGNSLPIQVQIVRKNLPFVSLVD